MAIQVQCDECFASFSVKSEHAGKRGKCPECGAAVTVPASGATSAPPKPAPQRGTRIPKRTASQPKSKLPLLFAVIGVAIVLLLGGYFAYTALQGTSAPNPAMTEPPVQSAPVAVVEASPDGPNAPLAAVADPAAPSAVTASATDSVATSAALAELIAVVPPPADPSGIGTAEQLEAVQREFGIRLPSDYLEFLRTYGKGWIEDPEHTEIRFTHFFPFDSDYVQQVRGHLRDLDEFHDVAPDYHPYSPFRGESGLFPWGTDVDGNTLYWLVGGESDPWPIVAAPHEGKAPEWERFEMPATSFLAKAIKRQIKVGIWREPYFDNPQAISFKAYPEH